MAVLWHGNFKLFKDRASAIFGVWAAPGAPETLPKGGGPRSPPFGRVSRAPGVAQTSKMTDFRSLKILELWTQPKYSHETDPGHTRDWLYWVLEGSLAGFLGGAFLRFGRPRGPGKALGGLRPPPFGRVSGAPGAAQTPKMTDFQNILQKKKKPKCSHVKHS